jgi:hypothetical protein
MYRWHLIDPIVFHVGRHRVSIQALAWRSDGRYRQLQDDIASTCFFYLDAPTAARPAPPVADTMEVWPNQRIGTSPTTEANRLTRDVGRARDSNRCQLDIGLLANSSHSASGTTLPLTLSAGQPRFSSLGTFTSTGGTDGPSTPSCQDVARSGPLFNTR